MPEVTITLESHDEELAVFGSRDQFLRQVRDVDGNRCRRNRLAWVINFFRIRHKVSIYIDDINYNITT